MKLSCTETRRKGGPHHRKHYWAGAADEEKKGALKATSDTVTRAHTLTRTRHMLHDHTLRHIARPEPAGWGTAVLSPSVAENETTGNVATALEVRKGHAQGGGGGVK